MNFLFGSKSKTFLRILLDKQPDAVAQLRGDKAHRDLRGSAAFFQVPEGVLMRVEVSGLPEANSHCDGGVFGFHIHDGVSCTGNDTDPFANAGSHLNPFNCPHPGHAGDLPPLFANDGYVWTCFLTNRFTIPEVIGKTLIIHGAPDDFTTQPSGNAGAKIACGTIQKNGR